MTRRRKTWWKEPLGKQSMKTEDYLQEMGCDDKEVD
jgi:hypothetical protein